MGIRNRLTPPAGFFTGASSCFSRFLTSDCTSVPGRQTEGKFQRMNASSLQVMTRLWCGWRGCGEGSGGRRKGSLKEEEQGQREGPGQRVPVKRGFDRPKNNAADRGLGSRPSPLTGGRGRTFAQLVYGKQDQHANTASSNIFTEKKYHKYKLSQRDRGPHRLSANSMQEGG